MGEEKEKLSAYGSEARECCVDCSVSDSTRK